MKNIPERIFLKLGFEPEATDDFNDLNEVTWSTGGDADDIEYVLAASPDSYREALEALLNELPENRPLYRDSGLWQVRSDDMEDVICQQQVNETFLEFIDRYQNDSARTALAEKEVSND